SSDLDLSGNEWRVSFGAGEIKTRHGGRLADRVAAARRCVAATRGTAALVGGGGDGRNGRSLSVAGVSPLERSAVELCHAGIQPARFAGGDGAGRLVVEFNEPDGRADPP